MAKKRRGNETLRVTRDEMETFLTEVCQTGIRSNHRRAFNETEVEEIRQRTLEGIGRKEIGESLGVCTATIGAVVRGDGAYFYDDDR